MAFEVVGRTDKFQCTHCPRDSTSGHAHCQCGRIIITFVDPDPVIQQEISVPKNSNTWSTGSSSHDAKRSWKNKAMSKPWIFQILTDEGHCMYWRLLWVWTHFRLCQHGFQLSRSNHNASSRSSSNSSHRWPSWYSKATIGGENGEIRKYTVLHQILPEGRMMSCTKHLKVKVGWTEEELRHLEEWAVEDHTDHSTR